jgi:hypothetical protein
MFYSALLLASSLLTGTPSGAQQSAAGNGQMHRKPETVVVTGDPPKKNKKVCQTVVPTGSIMPQTVCRTEAESEQIRERSLVELERMSDLQREDHQIRENKYMRDTQ